MKSAIASAKAMQADLLGDEVGAVYSADGRLAHATEPFAAWVTPQLREIADTLEISANTVHYHLRNIYDRLGIASRAELASCMANENR